MYAKYTHRTADCLRNAAAARASPAYAPQATYIMADNYVTPLVNALWAGEAVDATVAAAAARNAAQVLGGLPAAERDTTRAKACTASITRTSTPAAWTASVSRIRESCAAAHHRRKT
jgi:hypothetical protein